MLRRKIHDENILWLLREIIASNPQACPPLPPPDSLHNSKWVGAAQAIGRRGIPIGNLTSQIFANVYLNELDHFVKRVLREKYYIRYMDDFLIFGLDKKHLREDKERIRMFLRDRLKLEMHPKKAEIFPIDKGIDFLGYVIRGNRRFLRKSTVKRFLKKSGRYAYMFEKRKVSKQRVLNMHASWRGYAMFADSYRLMEKLGLSTKKSYL